MDPVGGDRDLLGKSLRRVVSGWALGAFSTRRTQPRDSACTCATSRFDQRPRDDPTARMIVMQQKGDLATPRSKAPTADAGQVVGRRAKPDSLSSIAADER